MQVGEENRYKAGQGKQGASRRQRQRKKYVCSGTRQAAKAIGARRALGGSRQHEAVAQQGCASGVGQRA